MKILSRLAQPVINAVYYGTRGVKRTRSRPQFNMKKVAMRDYYAGLVDRLTSGFTGTQLSVNESLKKDLDRMRNRSRELVNDNDYGNKYINMVKINVVGSKGIKLQARSKGADGKPDKTDNDAIETAWKDFCKRENFNVTGLLSCLDTQNVTVASAATDGECLIRIVKGGKYKYGIAFQLIEADRLDTQYNQEASKGKNRITMGIEYDEFDVPIAYHILTSYPGDPVYKFGSKKYLRLPASEIIHLFKPERISQARGIPWMHSSIRRINMVGGYEEAELVAARAGASKMGFYTSETGDEYEGDDQLESGELIEEAEPGVMRQLPANVKFESYDPQHPTGAYNYFMTGVLKGAAAGLGVSYTGFTGDLTAVNYSSIRAGLIEERETWRTIQAWYTQHFMDRIYKEWLTSALTRGLIINGRRVVLPLSKKDKFLNITWQSRGWAWVDPLKDQQANDAAVAAGHITNSEVAASQGRDLEEVYEQLAIEKELAKSYGLDFTGTTEGTEDEEEDDEEEVIPAKD